MVARSKPDEPKPEPVTAGDLRGNGFAAGHLLSFVERYERLDEEKKAIQGDMKEVMDEAKGTGFDTKILRRVIALRKMDPADRQENEAMVDLYMNALHEASRAATEKSKAEGI